MKKTKALVLMSGGLDSMLAARILMEQGIKVTGLTFISNFFGAVQSRKTVKVLGIELIEYDFSEEHLKMVKNPKHGYGKNMNPCIDCHGLMVRKAYEIMKEKGFDFISTGEVLGQRPKSQNKSALGLVEKYGNLDGHLLRPLSAKLLAETKVEKEGLVDRKQLFDIEGRNRERQMKLAEKYGITEYPAPGGGCVLTYSEYSDKLKKMIEKWPECNNNDISLLRAGRIFWFNDILVVVGRHEEDNKNIEKLVKKNDLIFELKDETGPFVLLRDKNLVEFNKFDIIEIDVPNDLTIDDSIIDKNRIVKMTALMTGYFSPKVRGKKIKVILK